MDEQRDLHTYFHQIPYQSDSVREIEEELDVKGITQCQAILWTNAAILVPEQEFDENRAEEYMRQARFPATGARLVTNTLDGIRFLWSCPDMEIMGNDPFFSRFELYHPQFSFLRNIGTGTSGVHAAICGSALVVTIIGEEGLLLSNQFEIRTEDDLVYYLLAAYRKAYLDPMTVPLQLSGNISDGGSMHRRLRQFIAHCRWESPERLHTDSDFPYPMHLFTAYAL